ncbi:MAG: transaldolase family protein [Terriglobia bacterium]|jgi:transaldolase
MTKESYLYNSNRHKGGIVTKGSYLSWLARETLTSWWHDSADPDELREGLDNGASGVTTNPLLVNRALSAAPAKWTAELKAIPLNLPAEENAEQLLRAVVRRTAKTLQPYYERSAGRAGYVCAQVNPGKAGDAAAMLAMATRFQGWAPNVAVKLPVTAAGLDALEESAARGINVTATVSFTVAQAIAVAERYRRGLARARQAVVKPGRCFAVLMIGRLDDYLRDVAQDRRADVTEADIRQAGLAVAKRAYAIFQERGYEATLLPAAMRGAPHVQDLAGADMTLSIHPSIQAPLLKADPPRQLRIGIPVPEEVVRRLLTIPEFARAYEPDAMKPEEFITFGLSQRVLSQFLESGWKCLEAYHQP